MSLNISDFHLDIFVPPEVSPQRLHDLRTALGIVKIRKEYKPHEGCDLKWSGRNDNFSVHWMFYSVCKIIGYEEKTIPAAPERITLAIGEHTVKVPIWDCKEVETEESNVN